MTSTHPRFSQTLLPLALLLGSFSLSLCAETRYVTDELQLSMHEEVNSQGKLIKRLSSGTALELLETQGLYAKVRTQEGLEGWTKAGFLISEKPARAQLEEAKQKVDALTAQLEQSREALAAAETNLSNLKNNPGADEAANSREKQVVSEEISASLEALQQENQDLRQQLDSRGSQFETVYTEGIPLQWGLIGSALALLLGIFGGIALFDYRSRRRHGGFRVY